MDAAGPTASCLIPKSSSDRMSRSWRCILAVISLASLEPAWAQQASPPAVGVEEVERKPITETSEFLGRVQAINRVQLSARVTAFLEKRLFAEGSEVKQGDLLYRLEQGPFEADVQAKQAAVMQIDAQLRNSNLTLDRAQELLRSSAGTQATVDSAQANQLAQSAQLLAAQAQLRQSQINFAYTEIRAPIDGKIGRTATTQGNVVTPTSGVLTTIVSQDPMYVVFSVSVRTVLDLRDRYADKGGARAVALHLKLPNGRAYAQTGQIDFSDNTIQAATDTLIVRGVFPNPVLPAGKGGDEGGRELFDNEFVTVYLEGVQPIEVLAAPRSAILSDQQGDYVYVVDAQNKAQRQKVTLGQSTPTVASVTSGLKEGDTIVVEGIQRVRPGQPVSPGPPTAPPVPSTSSAPGK
jgi:membrane fusion protein (multidrug efflux system)